MVAPNIGGVGEIILLDGNKFYTVEVIAQLTGCSNTRTEFLNVSIPNIEIINLNVTDIANCLIGGQIEAEVDSSGVAVVDFTNYDFSWYRGQTVSPGNEYPESGNILSDSAGVNLYSDYFTVFVENITTHCFSDTVSTFINPPPTLHDIQSQINNYPSNCGEFGGVLSAWVDPPPAGGNRDTTSYDFYWHRGVNINPGTNFYTNPAVEFSGDSVQIDSLNKY